MYKVVDFFYYLVFIVVYTQHKTVMINEKTGK